MDRQDEQLTSIQDLSGGMQEKTTEFLQRDNELSAANNSRYQTLGGVSKSEGYTQIGADLTSTTSTSTSSSTTTTSTSSSTSTSTTSTSSSTSTTTTA